MLVFTTTQRSWRFSLSPYSMWVHLWLPPSCFSLVTTCHPVISQFQPVIPNYRGLISRDHHMCQGGKDRFFVASGAKRTRNILAYTHAQFSNGPAVFKPSHRRGGVTVILHGNSTSVSLLKIII
jgi:hypothetical protein